MDGSLTEFPGMDIRTGWSGRVCLIRLEKSIVGYNSFAGNSVRPRLCWRALCWHKFKWMCFPCGHHYWKYFRLKGLDKGYKVSCYFLSPFQLCINAILNIARKKFLHRLIYATSLPNFLQFITLFWSLFFLAKPAAPAIHLPFFLYLGPTYSLSILKFN